MSGEPQAVTPRTLGLPRLGRTARSITSTSIGPFQCSKEKPRLGQFTLVS